MSIAHLLALHSLSEIGSVRLAALLEYFGDAEAAWQNPAEWSAALPRPLSAAARAQIKQEMQQLDLLALYERFLLSNARVVTLPEPHYPQLLREIDNPPYLLFYRGQLPKNEDLCIAIVGSRRATSYGREAAGYLAGGLAKAGAWVVAGLARGVDAAAHSAALRAGGKTIGVLGCGIDMVYPRENRELFQRMPENGCIISEYPLGMQPLSKNFPYRNRIISGLCRGIIVVEAGLRSGTQITVGYALEQGRDVYAVPGSIFSPVSQGTISLLKKGEAMAISSAEDVLEDQKLLYSPQSQQTRLFAEETPPGLSQEEQQIWQALAQQRHFNELAAELNLSAGELSARLTLCEIKGIIQRLDGQYFARKNI